ncbi:MBOAT family O-acyltransferase [Chakrabartyella piscis]|uniref:MBOAT family O-acyltransferase n=1 Tax=Chakrabartyella piscis TaxID=2918914 RepID=UPI002958580F|nr:MBOAT family O-acyltransferase [Chakrabartyella piscis]
MSFTSVEFIIFLILVMMVYFLTPKRYRWVALFVANYVFYYFAGGGYFLYLILTTLSIYGATMVLDQMIGQNKRAFAQVKDELDREQKKLWKANFTKKKKKVLLAAVLFNFGILAVLKYSGFVGSNINAVFSGLSLGISVPTYDFLLPLGISFYTFQSIGYLIDVYREKQVPERNLAKVALFLSFFPQMVQGPISRFSQLAEQLYRPNAFSYDRAKFGVQLMVWGAFKKLVIADRARVIVDAIFGFPETFTGTYVAVGALVYCVQLYGDFSGGIDIATGAAQILGIDLEKNFERPYLATSIPDFWRRWHITLGAWFRDYVFYPLSLSKFSTKMGKKARKVFGNYVGKLFPVLIPQFIIFFLIGVWHGAEWKYIAFGFYNGTLIVLGILLEQPLSQLADKLGIKRQCFSWHLWQILRTLALVAVGKIITRAAGIGQSVSMLKSMVESWDTSILFGDGLLQFGLDVQDMWVLTIAILVLLAVSIMQETGISIRTTLAKQNILFRWVIYLIAIFTLFIFGVYGLEYDASDFIYRGF